MNNICVLLLMSLVPLPCRGRENQEGAFHGGRGAEGLMELLCPVKIPGINAIRSAHEQYLRVTAYVAGSLTLSWP
jgi:hypothetical protein